MFFPFHLYVKNSIKKSINRPTENTDKFILLCQFFDEKSREAFFNELQTAFINSRSVPKLFPHDFHVPLFRQTRLMGR